MASDAVPHCKFSEYLEVSCVGRYSCCEKKKKCCVEESEEAAVLVLLWARVGVTPVGVPDTCTACLGVCVGVTLFGAPDTLAVVRRGCYSYCWCNGVITTRVGVTPVGVPDTCAACLGVCVGVTLFGAPDILN